MSGSESVLGLFVAGGRAGGGMSGSESVLGLSLLAGGSVSG